jgi:sugar phosphate isomerase/epimerase
MARFALSSWSLDGLLQSGVPLLEIPKRCTQHDIHTLELCHFHLPSTDVAYQGVLRQALEDAGVELSKLLIDTGDITAPDPVQRGRDLGLIQRWIATAAGLGAKEVRIDAGHQPPTPEVIERSAQGLRLCADHAADYGLRTITENWHTTAQEAATLLTILQLCEGRIGLCADTGNAEATPDKYETLTQLFPYASSVHFKAQYKSADEIEMDDVERCNRLLQQAGFDGAVTLIYAEKENEWEGIEQLRRAIEAYL